MHECDGAVEGLTHGDGRSTQAIAPPLSLELVGAVLELHTQRLGDGTGVVQREDPGQVWWGLPHGALDIDG